MMLSEHKSLFLGIAAKKQHTYAVPTSKGRRMNKDDVQILNFTVFYVCAVVVVAVAN